MRRRLAGALLLTAAVACERPPSKRPLALAACSDSVPRVAYAPETIARAPVATYSVRKRVGAVEGQPGVAWGRIADAAMGADGDLYVLDAMEKRIFVHRLDDDGLRSIGGPGRGPAEFEYPTALRLVGDSLLRVFDPLLWRVSTFDTAGEALSVATPPPDAQMGQVWEGGFTAQGALVHLGYGRYEPSLMDELAGRREGVLRGTTVLQLWRDGASWTPIADVPGPEVHVNLDRGEIRDVPFAKRPLWDVARDGIWYADNATYALERITLDGERACTIEVRVEPPTVTDDDRRSFAAGLDVDDSDARQRVIEQRKGVPIQERRPALARLVAARDGVSIQCTSVGTSPGAAQADHACRGGASRCGVRHDRDRSRPLVQGRNRPPLSVRHVG